MAKEIIYLTAEGYKKLKEEQILSKVTLLNHTTHKQMTYPIVAEHEANLREGKLAIGTPIAKALLGRKKGDCVDVDVPAGTIHFEILDISI